MHERGDALRMLGVGKAFKEAIGRAQGWKSHFRPADQRGETFVVAFARFAKEHRFNPTAGAKRFFDEADAFDADRAGLRGQTAAERHAEFLEPSIVAAREDAGRGSPCSAAGGFAWRGHQGSVANFRGQGLTVARGKPPDGALRLRSG